MTAEFDLALALHRVTQRGKEPFQYKQLGLCKTILPAHEVQYKYLSQFGWKNKYVAFIDLVSVGIFTDLELAKKHSETEVLKMKSSYHKDEIPVLCVYKL
jgi:hypothetical protein